MSQNYLDKENSGAKLATYLMQGQTWGTLLFKFNLSFLFGVDKFCFIDIFAFILISRVKLNTFFSGLGKLYYIIGL